MVPPCQSSLGSLSILQTFPLPEKLKAYYTNPHQNLDAFCNFLLRDPECPLKKLPHTTSKSVATTPVILSVSPWGPAPELFCRKPGIQETRCINCWKQTAKKHASDENCKHAILSIPETCCKNPRNTKHAAGTTRPTANTSKARYEYLPNMLRIPPKPPWGAQNLSWITK